MFRAALSRGNTIQWHDDLADRDRLIFRAAKRFQCAGEFQDFEPFMVGDTGTVIYTDSQGEMTVVADLTKIKDAVQIKIHDIPLSELSTAKEYDSSVPPIENTVAELGRQISDKEWMLEELKNELHFERRLKVWAMNRVFEREQEILKLKRKIGA